MKNGHHSEEFTRFDNAVKNAAKGMPFRGVFFVETTLAQWRSHFNVDKLVVAKASESRWLETAAVPDPADRKQPPLSATSIRPWL